MNYLQRNIERSFERLTSIAVEVLSNSITFFVVLVAVIFWLSNKRFHAEDMNDRMGDIFDSIIILSMLIIQKSFKRFSSTLHLKVNELVKSHEPASNTVINSEEKTDREIAKLIDDYEEVDISIKVIDKKA